MSKKISELDLNESTKIDTKFDCAVYVRKVPGGWLYEYFCGGNASATFVPHDSEFESQAD